MAHAVARLPPLPKGSTMALPLLKQTEAGLMVSLPKESRTPELQSDKSEALEGFFFFFCGNEKVNKT